MATIEELQKWCDKSRQLLKTKKGALIKDKTEQSAALKKIIDTLLGRFKEMSGHKALVQVYQQNLAEFEKLQKAFEADAKKNEKKSSDERNAVQVDYTKKFAVIELAITKAMREKGVQPQLTPDQAKAKAALDKARDEYTKSFERVNNDLELLKVTPKATAVNAERLLTAVQEGARQDTVEAYEAAVTDLKAVAEEIKKQKVTAEGLHKAELVQWNKKPEVLEKLQQAEALYAELSQLVGIDALLKKLRGNLDAAQKLVKGQNFTAALAELERAGKADALRSEATQQSAMSNKSLDQIAECRAAKSDLETLKKLLPPDEVAKHEAAWLKAQNGFLATAPKGKDALLKVVDDLKTAADTATADTKALRGLTGDLDVLMSRQAKVSPETALLSFKVSLENYKALVTSKRIADAKALGARLKGEIEAAYVPCAKAQADWQKQKGEAEKLRKSLEALRTSPCLAVANRVGITMGHVSEQIIQTLESENNWVKLVANLEQGRVAIPELQKLHDDHAALDTVRGELDAEVKLQAGTLDPELQQLQKAVDTAAKAGTGKAFDAKPPFKAQIDAALRAWSTAMANVADAKALKAAAETALKELEAISAKVREGATDEGMKGLMKANASQENEPVFNQEWKAFEAALKRVLAFDNAMAAQLQARGQKVLALARVDYTQARSELSTLLGDTKRLFGQQSGVLDKEHTEVKALAQQVLDDITRIKKDGKTANAKSFEEAFKALEAERVEWLQMGASSNRGAIKEAMDGLKALKLRVAKFAPDTVGGTSMAMVSLILGTTVQLFDGMSAELKRNDPKMLETLQKLLVQLKVDIYRTDPEDAKKKMEAFEAAAKRAQTDAKKVEEIRTQFNDMLPGVKSAYELLAKRKIAPKYTAELKARLGKVEELAKQPAKLYEALNKLKTLDTELSAAATDLSKVMGKEKELIEGEQRQEANKAEWKRAVKVCEEVHLKAAEAAVDASGGDRALLKELTRMVKLARKTAEDGDLVKALQQIELTSVRAKQIQQDPYGPSIGARNQLPQDVKRYGEALGLFNKALDSLLADTVKVVPNMAPAVGDKMKRLIDAVKSKFDPNVFAGPIQKLTAEGLNDGQRRALREAALTTLRSVQATLDQSPQITLLLENPVAKSQFSVAFRAVQSRLAALDANIQRSCA